MAYEHILVETRGSVGLITLNRPKAMNALCADLAREIAEAVDAYEAVSYTHLTLPTIYSV